MQCDCDPDAIIGGNLGKVGKLCKAHVEWMREFVCHEREACAKIADECAARAWRLYGGRPIGDTAEGNAVSEAAALIRARDLQQTDQ